MADAEGKLSKQRLSVLDLAETLSNVSAARRRRDLSRDQFHEYKCRFQTDGLEGLKDMPPVAKSHPQTTSRELALDHPGYGCNRLEAFMRGARATGSQT